ncbi:MAG: aldehyde dehydrogenase (NADP(+)) [Planctomycetes bacterium]|nr:aldehyde dehydrogenase (NADP(+)) [Planctomycetota bacterium]
MTNNNPGQPVPVLLDGKWQTSNSTGTFQATNPTTGEKIATLFPISSWKDCELALQAAEAAFWELKKCGIEKIAKFLELYADKIDADKATLVELANRETGLPTAPRLGDVELPRTTNQLRIAAKATREGSWSLPTVDTKANIRSCYQALGPIAVFGPNNFPFAFGSLSGGDFAAAIAAGNPVIGKANSSHPETTKRFAELAIDAVREAGLPLGTIQLIYRTSHDDGMKLVSDHRIGATGYTGSRHAGLALKAAADAAGKPIYLELSSVNPVVFLPGALAERGEQLVDEYLGSVLMGTGQFCTNPGFVLVLDNADGQLWIERVAARFKAAPCGTLLSPAVQRSLTTSVQTLVGFGAKLLAGGTPVDGPRCAYSNTLLEITASTFVTNPEGFQTEAFGNAALVVKAKSVAEMVAVLKGLEGNLTGCIYSATKDNSDDAAYSQLAEIMEFKVGRMLNDKMPTGVAVSPAMNHGGPYPSTGHPGFTAVGLPASMLRFAKLTCFDNVRPHRLPDVLRDPPANAQTWRMIDLQWKQG